MNIPSPNFDTKKLHSVFQDFKDSKIVSENGSPFLGLYIKGNLNVINTSANRVLGSGTYKITKYCETWYYVRLKEIPQKSTRGWEAGRPRRFNVSLLTKRWTTPDYYLKRFED